MVDYSVDPRVKKNDRVVKKGGFFFPLKGNRKSKPSETIPKDAAVFNQFYPCAFRHSKPYRPRAKGWGILRKCR